MNWSADTQLAIKAARQGGEAVMRLYDKTITYELKSDDSPVTDADIQSNDIISNILAAGDYPILTEEGADDVSRLDAEYVWVVDPLDGTAEFVNRTGEFTVMVSLVKSGVPVVGVIDSPHEGLTYAAESGQGAWMYQKGVWNRIGVSKISNVLQSRVLVSRTHNPESERNFIEELHVKSLQSKGSSLKVMAVSSGEADAYITFSNRIKEWDTAASYCILHEAGGVMTDMQGCRLVYNQADVCHQNGILATNGHLHDCMMTSYSRLRARKKSTS
jgi:3'(2'), 5'-bisphosphate nucleotidase